MSHVYFAYLSFGDVVAPIGAAAHHVGEGRFLLVSISRVCSFFAAVSVDTVGPAVLWGTDGNYRLITLFQPW